jgi:hypothetical protein
MLSAIQRTMLDIALRPTSNEREAEAALHKLRQRLPAAFSVDDLLGAMSAGGDTTALQAQLDQLTALADERAAEILRLQHERTALKAALREVKQAGAAPAVKATATRATASRREGADWRAKDIRRLRQLLAGGHTQAEAAAVLSHELRRKISQPAISRLISRLRQEGRW